MPRKTAEEIQYAARIRAHLRQYMAKRQIDQAELARRMGSDDGNMSRILDVGRGIGLSNIIRICLRLGFDPTHLLEENPPAKFFVGEPVAPLPRRVAVPGAGGPSDRT